tara:strand:- start:875 stop:1684 length:810 start_codon:yes stop_codon:yes gene_type:complete
MKNIVLSGGGMKGICYTSLLKLFNEYNLYEKIEKYGGSSVGALYSLLLLLEYDYDDIYNLIINNNFEKFTSLDILGFMSNYGICNQKKMKSIIEILIKRKVNNKDITFIELYNLKKKELHIVSFDISNGKNIIFNKNKTPNIKVVDSICASCCIPILFGPYEINNIKYIDNFKNNNFPLYIFNDDLDNTLGIDVSEIKYKEIKNIKNYFENLLNSIIYNDNLKEKLKNYISLKTNIDKLNFILDRKTKKKEIENSYNLLKSNLKSLKII